MSWSSFRAKQLFSIKLWKILERFSILINVDESSFSRLTKKEFTWMPKGKSQIIKNICFKNSWSLIIAITSTGGVIATKINGNVSSSLFVKFMKELILFIKDNEDVEIWRSLVLLDNASTHHANITKDYIKSEGLNVAFIPQYCPEMAPV